MHDKQKLASRFADDHRSPLRLGGILLGGIHHTHIKKQKDLTICQVLFYFDLVANILLKTCYTSRL